MFNLDIAICMMNSSIQTREYLKGCSFQCLSGLREIFDEKHQNIG